MNKFYENGGNYLFGVEEGKNDEYKVIKFPNAKLQEADNIHYQKRPFEYKEGCNLFEDFANYWKEEEYGQTLVWKYNRIAGETFSDDVMIFSIVLLFNHILPEEILEDLRSMLDQFILSFSSKKVSEYFHISSKELREREAKLNRRSIQYAVSQVFVRNMSHNIISHVMVNLQDKEAIQNIGKMINKGNYTGINLTKEEANSVLSKEYQLAILNKYNSNRCLYLNEATYSVSKFVENMNVYSDLFRKLDENRIFLNLISAVDNFKYRFSFLCQGEVLTKENDIAVMIPGGSLGQQAFYNIIENIIRNTAKHSGNRESKEVTFTVNFSEYDENIDMLGNITALKQFLNLYSENPEMVNLMYGGSWFFKKDIDYWEKILELPQKYYQVEIYDDIDKGMLTEDVVDNLNGRIFGSVIEKDALRSHSLGILEMKASAAFLRQIDIVQIDPSIPEGGEADFIPFIMAFVHQQGDKKSIGYRFFMKKVEKYLVICSKEYTLLTDENKNKSSKWKNVGIELISVEDFLEKIESKVSFNHEFVLLLTQEAKEEVGAIGEYFYSNHKEKKENRRKDRISELSLLPERLMYIEEDFLSEVGETQIEEFFSQKIWEQWEGIRKEGNKNYLAINTKTIKTGTFANYDDCKQVVFHNHLYSMEDWEKVVKEINKDKITVEPLSSAAQRKLPYFDIYQSSLDKYVIEIRKNDKYFITQQLIEAYFNKVIVIDERIQKFASAPFFTNGNETLYQRDIFDHINVLMPKAEEVDLNNESLSDEYIQRIEEFITENIPESEFLVVHYGLFERIYGKENHNEMLNSKLLEWSKLIRTIVVTGRGQHTLEGLPEAVNYLNLSSLLDAFRDNRNKYSINYILNQTRR